MKILYIFPHPDDESFGPAPAISQQKRNGDEVCLLTLTKGEATKQRHRLGVNKREMGKIRHKEMKCVEEVLDLDDMTVWDFEDNALKEMDPRKLENAINAHIRQIQPDVVVTYAVHGVSGFEDHLVTHAVVKRVFCELKEKGVGTLRRLALFTIADDYGDGKFDLNGSSEEDIDAVLEVDDTDMQQFNDALDCYETYQQVIEESGVRDVVGKKVYFELFQEEYSPPLKSLTEEMG